MLPLVKRLRAESAVCDSRGDADGRALIYDCFTLLMGHTSVLIAGTRDEELQGIASGKDALLRLVERLQPQRNEEDAPRGEFGVGKRWRRLRLHGLGLSPLRSSQLVLRRRNGRRRTVGCYSCAPLGSPALLMVVAQQQKRSSRAGAQDREADVAQEEPAVCGCAAGSHTRRQASHLTGVG